MTNRSITIGLTFSMALVLPLALGCKKAPQDKSRVIATAGSDKITETEFQDLVRGLSPDKAQAESFLTNPAAREARAQLADQLAMQKSIVAYAGLQGLTKDPIVQRQLERAQAQVYLQTLVTKRLAGMEPTDAQLKALYDERVAAMKAQGGSVTAPPFEQVKAQLPTLWRQQRQQEITQEVEKEIRARFPVTLADDYKPVAQ